MAGTQYSDCISVMSAMRRVDSEPEGQRKVGLEQHMSQFACLPFNEFKIGNARKARGTKPVIILFV